jgi:hypothetical protein
VRPRPVLDAPVGAAPCPTTRKVSRSSGPWTIDYQSKTGLTQGGGQRWSLA